jgi:Tfp pilus assembly protein PilO
MTKTRQWAIMTAVAVLVVFAAGYFLLVKPPQNKTKSLNSQAAAQDATNQGIETQIASLESEEKGLTAEQRELNKFSTQVPADLSEPSLIIQLTHAAAVAGVNLISITPGATAAVTASTSTSTDLTTPAASTGTLESLPVSLGVIGTYANMEMFFQQLQKMPRALLVGSWSLCPMTGSSGSTTSGASCTAPSVPTGYTTPPNAIGGTLSATVFFAPPAGSAEAAAGSTALTPTSTSSDATTTTPASTTTPAAGATTAPTN